MKVLDPGHRYVFQQLDDAGTFELHFVKREGENYPGNVGAHPGPTTQEVIRALIDRTKYVDAQICFEENESVLNALRLALFFLEARAKSARKEILKFSLNDIDHIEYVGTCETCGHIECTKHVDGI